MFPFQSLSGASLKHGAGCLSPLRQKLPKICPVKFKRQHNRNNANGSACHGFARFGWGKVFAVHLEYSPAFFIVQAAFYYKKLDTKWQAAL